MYGLCVYKKVGLIPTFRHKHQILSMTTFGQWIDQIQDACNQSMSPPLSSSPSHGATAPTGDFLLRRAIRSAAQRPQPQPQPQPQPRPRSHSRDEMSDEFDMDRLWIPDFMRGDTMLVFSTTTSTTRTPSSPPPQQQQQQQQQQKECPLCKALVRAPTQCFAVPEGSPKTKCCVCDESFDMRTEQVVLSCMHPLCKSCWERMPGA